MDSKCPIFTDKCPFLNEYKQKCPHYNKEVQYTSTGKGCPFMSKECPYLKGKMDKCPHFKA